MSKKEIINARVSPDEKTYLTKRFGSITNAIRSLLPKLQPLPDPDQYIPKPLVAYVIAGNHQQFRHWQDEQKLAAEEGREFFDPWRAVFVSSLDRIRGLALHREQVVKVGTYWQRHDFPEINAYLHMSYAMREAM